jgi:hypothetical protein
MDPVNDEARAWARLIAQLALMPDVVERLRAAHADDGNGRCRACTTPGRGTPQVRWPCGPASMGLAAHRLREATEARIVAALEEIAP